MTFLKRDAFRKIFALLVSGDVFLDVRHIPTNEKSSVDPPASASTSFHIL